MEVRDQLHILHILPLRRACDTTGQETESASAENSNSTNASRGLIVRVAAGGTSIRVSDVRRYAVSYMVIKVSDGHNASIFREREAGTSSETMATI
jgi:hypothetical protein